MATISTPGWDLLIRLLDALVEDINARLDGNLLDSRAEYTAAHGRRSGLLTPTRLAHALVAESERKRREQSRKYEAAAEPAALGG